MSSKVNSDSQPASNKKTDCSNLLIIFISIIILAAATSIFSVLTAHQPVRLDAEYYDSSTVTDITKEEYEKLISEHKSFIVLVDNPGCITAERMRQMLSELPDSLQFKYYRLMWEDTKQSSLHQYVQYYPSLAIVKDGKVVAHLKADSDADAPVYNNPSDLEKWLSDHIVF